MAKEKTPTKAEMRVMIAKDVLLQVRSGFLEATCGTYFEASYNGAYNKADRQLVSSVDGYSSTASTAGATQVADLLSKDLKAGLSCNICAIGGAFVGAVRLFNELTLDALSQGTTVGNTNIGEDMTYLHQWFPANMLSKMEEAFEEQDYLPDTGDLYPQHINEWGNVPDRLENAYHKRYDAFPKKRLVDIFKNIIQNNGTFKPRQLPTLASYVEPKRRKK